MHYIQAKSILSAKGGMNLYRGCTHGCIYCDSRSTCYGMEHEFADVAVKENAILLLADALRRRRQPAMIGMGSMSDPYLPLEAELCHTRKALEEVLKYGFGVALITKSDLVLRDLDLLQEIHARTKCVVQMTLTTADDELCRKIEPDVCPTSRRAEVLAALQQAGIPTVVWLCPILPFINDTEENIRNILDICIRTDVKGVICFGMGVTLREGNREYFYQQLDRVFPGMKERYVRTFGNQYVAGSPNHHRLMALFHSICQQHGMLHDPEEIFAYLHAFETKEGQLSLFDGD